MKQKLTAGAELDLLTAGELRAALAELRDEGPRTATPEGAATLDASGNGLVTIQHSVPAGMEFTLHRLRIDVDGSDPGHLFTAAAGWADILRNNVAEDFVQFSAAAGGLPQVKTWPGAAGLVYRNGDSLQVQINAGPASVNVRVKAQGTLNPITES